MTNMYSKHYVCVIILTMLVYYCHCEVYTSVAAIKDEVFSVRNDQMRSKMKKAIEMQEERLDAIKGLIRKMDDLSGDEIRSEEFTVHHPLNAYRYIRNHSVIYNETASDLISLIKAYEKDRHQINLLASKLAAAVYMEDLEATIYGLIKLQETYNLSSTDLADGRFAGRSLGRLTAWECQSLMAGAYVSGMKRVARDWGNLALARVGDGSTTKNKIHMKGASSAFAGGDAGEAVILYNKVLKSNPMSKYLRHKMYKYKKHVSKFATTLEQEEQKRWEEKKEDFKQDCMCREQVKTKKKSWKKLFCRYQDNGNPSLRYSPVKLELLSLDPYIAVYHEAFNTSYLKNFVKFVQKNLESPSKPDKRALKPNLSVANRQMRISASSLLGKQTEMLTGLPTTSYEELQLVNYGIGGHYYNHHDYLPQVRDRTMSPKQHRNNEDSRLATFMIFMTGVEVGGGTLFPDVGQLVHPKAGTAVLWYNQYNNGTVHRKSRHTSCPVQVGDQWTATFYIRQYEQSFCRNFKFDCLF